MKREVDVVVLGLGTAGEDLALQLLDSGLEVAGVESQLLGGECPYWACIPSKAMVRSSNLVQEARRMNGVAGTSDVTPDWGLVAGRVREQITGDWDDSFAVARFEGKGGIFARGWGRLTGPKTVSVDDDSFTGRKGIVVATGSKPFIPPVPGLADVNYWTTHEAIAADPLPDSLIILGGGAVACELGQVFARFGCDVTIIEGTDRLLSHEEPEASEVIEAVFAAEGIAVVTGEHAASVSQGADGIEVRTEGGHSITASRLLVATGRTVDLSSLGLEEIGLDGSSRFIEVDDRMRAADGVWAIGDITGKMMLTHVGVYQSSIVVEDLLGKEPKTPDFEAMPRVTFSDPEVASVGLTEAMARERGIDVGTALKQVPATFRGWLHTVGNEGVVKLIVDRSRDVLVGATVVGPTAGEVLGLLTLAVHEGTSLERLRNMIYAFPTFHGGIGEALGAFGRGTGRIVDPDYDENAYLG
ncbi:MAG: NAD(P)/FAD-dependent oxidoreductase [Actinomycetota bacterium]|nr:NAD(P)/FAD-dependent oxidoreductase [Actinomycetota bacterium]